MRADKSFDYGHMDGLFKHVCDTITALMGGPKSVWNAHEGATSTWYHRNLFVDVFLDRKYQMLYIHAQYPDTDRYLVCSHFHEPTQSAVDDAISRIRASL